MHFLKKNRKNFESIKRNTPKISQIFANFNDEKSISKTVNLSKKI